MTLIVEQTLEEQYLSQKMIDKVYVRQFLSFLFVNVPIIRIVIVVSKRLELNPHYVISCDTK